MNKADGQDTADRLFEIVANSLDTQAKTQDWARQNYQSRTQFHRLFRTVVEETPAAIAGKSSLPTGAYRTVGHGDRFGRQLQLVRGVHSRFPNSISDLSQHLSAHA